VEREPSTTHDHAVLETDNGELQEDVVEKSVIDGEELDGELGDSFPARDPSSHRPGTGESSRDRDRTRRRFQHRRSAEEVPGRPDPGVPVPGRSNRAPRRGESEPTVRCYPCRAAIRRLRLTAWSPSRS